MRKDREERLLRSASVNFRFRLGPRRFTEGDASAFYDNFLLARDLKNGSEILYIKVILSYACLIILTSTLTPFCG